MENRESIPKKEVHVPGSREINRTRRKFLRVVRRLPQENQDFITEMTSILTEPDIYRSFKADVQNSENFRNELEQMGLGESKIKTVFNFFNLPYEKKV